MAAILFALLPVLNPLTGGASLVQSMAHGQWSIAGFDLMMLALAAIHGTVVWWLMRPQPAAKANTANGPRQKKTGVAAAASMAVEQTV